MNIFTNVCWMLILIISLSNFVSASKWDKTTEILEEMKLTAEQKKIIGTTRIDCAKKLNLSPQLIKDYDTRKLTEKNIGIAKLTRCIFEDLGTVNKDGSLDSNKIKKYLGDKNTEVIQNCAKKMDDIDDRFWELYSCYVGKFLKN